MIVSVGGLDLHLSGVLVVRRSLPRTLVGSLWAVGRKVLREVVQLQQFRSVVGHQVGPAGKRTDPRPLPRPLKQQVDDTSPVVVRMSLKAVEFQQRCVVNLIHFPAYELQRETRRQDNRDERATAYTERQRL